VASFYLAIPLLLVIQKFDERGWNPASPTGVGAALATNEVKGFRAAVCHDVHSAHQSVERDNVNVVRIGAKS
jgi:hypothetical protein